MASLELLERYLDSADAFAYIKDENGRFLMVNQHLADSTHCSKEELIGKTDYDLVSREVADRFRAVDREVIDSGKPRYYEDTFEMGGDTMTLLDHKFPISVEGHPHAVAGIAFQRH